MGLGFSGGGGASRLSVLEDFYRIIAEANMTMTNGASGALFDRVVDKGGFIILALAGSTRGTTWRAGTGYTVPTGKVAVIVDAKFDAQTLSQYTFYKHRLYNSTAGTCKVAASDSATAGTTSTVFGGYGGTTSAIISTWPAPASAVNASIPFPVAVATAGETIRAELAGGADANDRPVFGMYVIAIIDATTARLSPVV